MAYVVEAATNALVCFVAVFVVVVVVVVVVGSPAAVVVVFIVGVISAFTKNLCFSSWAFLAGLKKKYCILH